MKPSHTTPEALRSALGWRLFWVSVIGWLGVFDAWRATKRDGSTLSEVTRVLFRTDHPAGRAAFLAALAALAVHIIKQA